MTHKMLVLTLLISLAGCSAKPAGKPAHPTVKAAPHETVFTPVFRQQWYNVDSQGLPHTYQFLANAVVYDHVKTPVYWASERTKADNQMLDAGNVPTTHKAQWAAATETNGWLNLRGWYQLTGSGTSFQLKGQELWVASGAKPQVYAHFYPSRAFAQTHPDQKEIQP